jgi:protein O-GlcNAc transferase
MSRYPFSKKPRVKPPLKNEADPYFARLAEDRFQLAKRLDQQGKKDEAEIIFKELIASFRRLRLNPSNLLASYGFLLLNQSRFDEAEKACKESIKCNPEQSEALINLGVIYQVTERWGPCEEACRKALAIKAAEPKALHTLANAQAAQRKHGLAAQSFLLALAADPTSNEVVKGLAGNYVALGESDVSLPLYRKALNTDPESWGLRSNMLFAMQYAPTLSNEEVLAEHLVFGADVRQRCPAPRTEFPNLRTTNRRLRVGYLSADFGMHVVMAFVENALAHHDRDRVEVFCLSNLPLKRYDSVTQRIRERADHWINVHEVYDNEALELIEKLELDVVVDLMGHTSATRLTMLYRRMAPVQAIWCGYSGSTGVENVDYILVDNVIAPPGEKTFFSEEPIRLPNSFLCFTPSKDSPDVSPPPFEKNGYITFGCLNNPCKINRYAIGWWARILAAVPDSKLLLRYLIYNDPLVYERVARMLREAGVPDSRFEIYGTGPNFLKTYHRIDIALDPFPYNGTTTTCEALWMGIPVITLYGDRFVARVGASLLTYTGLPELVAKNPDDYVRRAVELAIDRDRLAKLRRELRSHVAETPVFDYPTFTKGLEDAYFEMFARWCAKAGSVVPAPTEEMQTVG